LSERKRRDEEKGRKRRKEKKGKRRPDRSAAVPSRIPVCTLNATVKRQRSRGPKEREGGWMDGRKEGRKLRGRKEGGKEH
jgi:hypothetical protein